MLKKSNRKINTKTMEMASFNHFNKPIKNKSCSARAWHWKRRVSLIQSLVKATPKHQPPWGGHFPLADAFSVMFCGETLASFILKLSIKSLNKTFIKMNTEDNFSDFRSFIHMIEERSNSLVQIWWIFWPINITDASLIFLDKILYIF